MRSCWTLKENLSLSGTSVTAISPSLAAGYAFFCRRLFEGRTLTCGEGGRFVRDSSQTLTLVGGPTQVKNWKRRYFELRDEFIYYYRAKGVPGPLGLIDLADAKGAGHCSSPAMQFGFEIVTSSRTYILVRPEH